MLVIPALDLHDGRVVRLRQGRFDRLTTYTGGAVSLARRYVELGARRLHVVDLDAASGTGDNRALVEQLVAETGAEVQVAGGVRSAEDADRWLAGGAAAVVMGTTAVREPARLASVAAAHPGQVLAALDVRAGRPAVSGWSAIEELTIAAVLERWADAPLGGVIVTSVDRDGTLAGPDLELLETARRATGFVAYSGGVRSLEDVWAVAEAGAASLIVGRALLEGLVSLPDALALTA